MASPHRHGDLGNAHHARCTQLLSPELAQLSRSALIFAAFLPASNVLHSWYQGALLHAAKSRPITEAVAIALVVIAGCLALGTTLNSVTGIYMALGALSAGALAQAAWLALRARPVLRELTAPRSSA